MSGSLLLRCTALTLLYSHDPWAWSERNEAAQVHYAARRGGGRVAAAGARTAAGDAGDRIPTCGLIQRICSSCSRIPRRSERCWLCRRSNVAIEYRWAEGEYDRLPGLAADLVRRQVAVIAATGGNPSAIAARAATTTIPIIFQAGSDPVEAGFVPNLNRPAGNTTGVSIISPELTAKRLEVLHEAMPTARTIAFLVNPRSVNAEQETREVQVAARALGHQIHILNVAHERDFDAAFTALTKEKDGALIVASDPLLTAQRGYLVALAAQHSVPAIYPFREFAAVGGLMSFGASIRDAFRQVGIYSGRILKGQKTTDLPVQLPTKFEFVINLKTAKTLGVTFPITLLGRADEVIE
jgi:putative ABC transport system substrate-binding protein